MPSTLRELLCLLQGAVAHDALDEACLAAAIDDLHALGYRYEALKFPPLPDNTADFDTSVGDAPRTLAEAMLWKLGKWPAYKSFSKNFCNAQHRVSADGGVVFSAFALHLQDQSNPIYDQHAIRALWAISSFSDEEEKRCTSLLFKGNGDWKDAGSGDDGACYQVFVRHVSALCERNRIEHGKLDKLLMPLGQAIKDRTRSDAKTLGGGARKYFSALCRSSATP
jgi:hypothetical protein